MKMSEKLPQDFKNRMAQLLDEASYQEFLNSYDTPRAYGLRYNPLKQEFNQFLEEMPFSLEKVSWAKEGFYYNELEHPGKHPLHEGGAYYIQEPSAMAVVELLDPKPGEVILDLCAAPGGKTSHIAGRLMGQGLLVANEYVPNRSKILAQNVERMGIANAVVLNETPERLSAYFPGFFDRMVVDAPCSGEGMFHKEDAAVTEWSLEQVQICKKRQQDILQEAAKMLKPGGVMVYSTCTFAPEEDEEIVAWFLTTHPDYEVELPEELEAIHALSAANENWAKKETDDTRILEQVKLARRIWPHLQKGEGHFLVRFRKRGTLQPSKEFELASKANAKKKKDKSAVKNDIWSMWEQFASEQFTEEAMGILKGRPLLFGEQLYLVPTYMPDLKGLKVARPGLHIGTDKKNRMEPSHALALAAQMKWCKKAVAVSDVEAYIRGETTTCDSAIKGYVIVTYRGITLGWGKAAGGVVKNHYPKGLRIDMKGVTISSGTNISS